jgi:hypothetical protein
MKKINIFVFLTLNYMKKLLLIGLVATFAVASCKKETPKTPEEIYSERLDGDWNVASLDYSAAVTIPGLGSIPLNGTSTNAGSISFTHASKSAVYDIKFLPSLPGLPPGTIDVDTVRLAGSGTYSNTTANITLTDTNGDIIVFNVIANEQTLQLLSTQLNYELDSVTTIPVTLQLRLGK